MENQNTTFGKIAEFDKPAITIGNYTSNAGDHVEVIRTDMSGKLPVLAVITDSRGMKFPFRYDAKGFSSKGSPNNISVWGS